MRWHLAVACVGLLACSDSGRRRSNGHETTNDASVEQPSTDLGIGPSDLAGGKSPADQAAAATLTGTIDIQRGGFVTAYFAWIAAGGGSFLSNGFSCETSGDCTACWTGAIVKQDMTPVDLWRPEDLTPPTYDLIVHDLWAPDLKPEVDLATVMANAGTLSFTGVSEPFTLATNSAGVYGYRLGGELWSDPVTIHIAAAGTLDVPAFETDLETTAEGSITEAPPVIDRSNPYTIKWPKADGVLQLSILTYYYLGYSNASITCSFDRNQGQATIPTAMLSHLYPTADQYVTQVTFRAGATKKLTSGKATIIINATGGVAAPAGQDPFSTL